MELEDVELEVVGDVDVEDVVVIGGALVVEENKEELVEVEAWVVVVWEVAVVLFTEATYAPAPATRMIMITITAIRILEIPLRSCI